MKYIIIILVMLVVISSVGIFLNGADNAFVDIPQNNSSAVIDFSNKSYIAFGDSITYGVDWNYGYRMPNPYPETVGTLLNLKSVSNQGISGATFVSGMSRNGESLDCITSHIETLTQSYDIISIMGGVNDYSVSSPLGSVGDTTKNTVYGALDTIARTLTTKFPKAFIFFMTPYKSISNGHYCATVNSQGYNLFAVADAVKNVAKKYDIPVLDMFGDGKFEVFGMDMDGCDGCHPTQNFVTNYTAPQIARFLRDNYDK